ncbi:MAG: ExeA family protein [Anaerolineaceae bacterium]
MSDLNTTNIEEERFKFSKLDGLGLREDPFVDSSDDRFLYLGDENTPLYKAALQSVVRRRGLMLVVGEPGVGKTILAKRLYTILSNEKDIDVAYIPTSGWETKFTAIQQISTSFKTIRVPEKRGYDDQLEALKTSIKESYEKGRNVVLILDDAQEIKSSGLTILHQLYNFSVNEKTVQSIHIAQLETTDILRKTPAIWSRVFQTLSLMRLSFNSTVGLVNYRVRVANRLEPLMDDSVFVILDEYAKGVPRDIVAACSKAMDLLLEHGGKVITKEIMISAVESLGKMSNQLSLVFLPPTQGVNLQGISKSQDRKLPKKASPKRDKRLSTQE